MSLILQFQAKGDKTADIKKYIRIVIDLCYSVVLHFLISYTVPCTVSTVIKGQHLSLNKKTFTQAQLRVFGGFHFPQCALMLVEEKQWEIKQQTLQTLQYRPTVYQPSPFFQLISHSCYTSLGMVLMPTSSPQQPLQIGLCWKIIKRQDLIR